MGIIFGNRLIALSINFILFLVLALMALALVFQPPTIEYEAFDQFGMKSETNFTFQPNALGDLGLSLRGKAWLKYPVYTGGLAAISAISFGAAIYTVWAFQKAYYQEVKVDNSNNTTE